MMNKTSIAIVLMALAVAGCNRSADALNVNTQKPPQPLPSVPSGNVQTTQLEPVNAQNVGQPQALPEVPATAPQTNIKPVTEPEKVETVVAAVEPEAPAAPKVSTKPLEHAPLAGSWNVPSDSSDCRIILAFTKWSGGYRAATRRCQSAEIGSVSAWDIDGSKVFLVDSAGNRVANLQSVGNNKYSGQTVSGRPISFSRQ